MAGTPERICVFGDGPAGLSTAMGLCRRGYPVTVIAPEQGFPYRSVYTTGNGLLEFCKRRGVGILPLPTVRLLTEGGSDIRINPHEFNGRYFIIDNREFLRALWRGLAEKGVVLERLPWKVLRNVGVEENSSGVVLKIDGDQSRWDLIVDATGVGAEIVRQVDPRRKREDFLTEYVYGGTYRGCLTPKELVLVFGPAGGTCWIAPSINEGFVDVVFSAWGPFSQFSRFLEEAPHRLQRLVDFVRGKPGIEIGSDKPEEISAGMIRSQYPSSPATERVYPVGEAGGMAKPFSGDSFRITIKEGENLARAITEGLSPEEYFKQWWRRGADPWLQAVAFARLPFQRRGKLGGLTDKFYRLTVSGRLPPDLVRQAEEWIVGGRGFDPRVVVPFLRNPQIVESMGLLVLYRAAFGLGWRPSRIPWSLPPLNS